MCSENLTEPTPHYVNNENGGKWGQAIFMSFLLSLTGMSSSYRKETAQNNKGLLDIEQTSMYLRTPIQARNAASIIPHGRSVGRGLAGRKFSGGIKLLSWHSLATEAKSLPLQRNLLSSQRVDSL